MNIQQIRNATVKINYGGKTFLVDPWLEDKGCGMVANAIRPEMKGLKCPLCPLPFSPEKVLADVDVNLLTHLHADHFTKDYLPKDLPMIVQNDADAEALRALGFSRVRAFRGDAMTLGEVRITKVHAAHGDNPELLHMMGQVSGYVLCHPCEKCLYIAGDTIYDDGVAEIIDTYAPEVILLNCCAATNPHGRLIMNLDDVESVARQAAEAVIIASHLDNVNHALVTRADVRRFIKDKNLNKVCVPDDGEILSL